MDDDDRALLDYENHHQPHTAAFEDDIRDQFGMSAARYYQRLGQLIRRRDVLEAYPQLVHRIERLHGERAEARRAKRL